ncbi:MAG: sigma-70 family RNA polymerase sigma factor [Bdellovibrionales bacterium]|nr:sigma-70 family RNA polymerase sigma factor [Bdellovibrionales bacterium]
MAAAQAGNTEAYRTLLSEVSHYVYLYLQRKMAGRPEVEDVVQESLLTVHRVRHTFDPERGDFKPWLHSIVESRLIDFWRKQKRKESNEVTTSDDLSDWIQAPQEISRLSLEELHKVINQIKPTQREIFIAVKIEGLTIREVANKFNMTEAAIKVTVHRAYKRILETMNGI